MSNDGVSIGPAGPQINPNVLLELFGSSETVQARIAQYQKVREDAEQSIADLKIGRDIKKAYDDANARSAAAEEVMKSAQASADSAINALAEANAKAKSILEEAKASYAVQMKEVQKARSDTDNYVANARADIDAKQKQLASALESVEKDKAAAKAAQTAATQSRAVSEVALMAAAKAEVEFKGKAAKLQEALGHVTAAG